MEAGIAHRRQRDFLPARYGERGIQTRGRGDSGIGEDAGGFSEVVRRKPRQGGQSAGGGERRRSGQKYHVRDVQSSGDSVSGVDDQPLRASSRAAFGVPASDGGEGAAHLWRQRGRTD